jgi:hypothetical protein
MLLWQLRNIAKQWRLHVTFILLEHGSLQLSGNWLDYIKFFPYLGGTNSDYSASPFLQESLLRNKGGIIAGKKRATDVFRLFELIELPRQPFRRVHIWQSSRENEKFWLYVLHSTVKPSQE